MNAHPDLDELVRDGRHMACERPESRVTSDTWFASSTCRPCLTASIAAGINRPDVMINYYDDDRVTVLVSPVAALRRVRAVLDECDPLRVRAEQALLPLVAS